MFIFATLGAIQHENRDPSVITIKDASLYYITGPCQFARRDSEILDTMEGTLRLQFKDQEGMRLMRLPIIPGTAEVDWAEDKFASLY